MQISKKELLKSEGKHILLFVEDLWVEGQISINKAPKKVYVYTNTYISAYCDQASNGKFNLDLIPLLRERGVVKYFKMSDKPITKPKISGPYFEGLYDNNVTKIGNKFYFGCGAVKYSESVLEFVVSSLEKESNKVIGIFNDLNHRGAVEVRDAEVKDALKAFQLYESFTPPQRKVIDKMGDVLDYHTGLDLDLKVIKEIRKLLNAPAPEEIILVA